MDPTEAVKRLDKLTNCATCEVDDMDREAIRTLLSACGRAELSEARIEEAVRDVHDKLEFRLAQKGRQSFASCHESYGIIAEEMDELLEAITDGRYTEINDELLDVAVAGVMAYASHVFVIQDWVSSEERDE